ncbi:MAG: hypothetical protein U1D30_11590 [Planctomycetota bacterium]
MRLEGGNRHGYMMKRVLLAGFAFVALAPGANTAAEQAAEVAVQSEP